MSEHIYRPKTLELTPEQIEAHRPRFDQLDTDKNGKIDVNETKEFMKQVGINPIFVKLVYELCDTDSDGLISFDEFIPFFKLLKDLEQDPSIIYRNIFEKFDKDKNGLLDKEEVREMLKLFSEAEWTDENIELFVEGYDKDKDGNLNFEEVCEMIGNDN